MTVDRRELTFQAESEGVARPGNVVSRADLDAFVTEHYGRLIRLARLLCRHPGDADDAVQAALEQAWRRRSSLRSSESLRAWLDRIVVRESIRATRASDSWLGRIIRLGSPARWIEPTDPRGEPSHRRIALQAAFDDLSAEQRAVIAVHLHAGYSLVETAELVGAPVETVRSRLRVARARLRRALEEVEP